MFIVKHLFEITSTFLKNGSAKVSKKHQKCPNASIRQAAPPIPSRRTIKSASGNIKKQTMQNQAKRNKISFEQNQTKATNKNQTHQSNQTPPSLSTYHFFDQMLMPPACQLLQRPHARSHETSATRGECPQPVIEKRAKPSKTVLAALWQIWKSDPFESPSAKHLLPSPSQRPPLKRTSKGPKVDSSKNKTKDELCFPLATPKTYGETYQYSPTGGFWKLLNTQKPPETTCWGVLVGVHPKNRVFRRPKHANLPRFFRKSGALGTCQGTL